MKKFQPIGDLIFFISKELKTRMDEGLKDRKLGQGQTSAIMTILKLKDTKDLGQDALSREMGINKANTSRNLAKLNQNGFINITPDLNDQRKKQIELTPKAFEEINSISKVLQNIHSDMIEGLSDEELTCTMNTLIKMRDNLCKK